VKGETDKTLLKGVLPFYVEFNNTFFEFPALDPGDTHPANFVYMNTSNPAVTGNSSIDNFIGFGRRLLLTEGDGANH
jgi:hypothetical protein